MNDENRHITAWGYIGYGILFALPVLGLICILVFSFSSTYPCRRNYARSYLILLVISLIVVGIMLATGFDFQRWYNGIRFNYYY